MTLAPFPTGPLAVWGADLARAMFVDCQYLQKYIEDGRHWNREGGCEARGGRAAKNARSRSFASVLCDAVVRWAPTAPPFRAPFLQLGPVGLAGLLPSPSAAATPLPPRRWATGSPCARPSRPWRT